MKAEWYVPRPPFPKAFFDALHEHRGTFERDRKFTITVEEKASAFVVKRGQTFRIICEAGPQIADLCIWNAHDTSERFANEYTLTREGIWLARDMRLWSSLPHLRPMMTVIEDTVVNKPIHPGARHHYLFGAHCNPHVWYWVTGDRNHPLVTHDNCYCNLTRAIQPYGLQARDLHDNVNLFMKCFVDSDSGLHPWEITDVKQGDYVEFYAEMDCLVAVSICPSASGRYTYAEQLEPTRPLGIEIFNTGRFLPDYVDPLQP
ncbi:hypothetical protein C3941_04295 [Kaistia algarum]|uniref:DUF1989 domain-containing protein n=1 Tax=Kaistia algarum TaxID=2083279 RepID=UPI000CE8B90C|nr:urea carboxylase-associated family protein [Kaistia algarum]MCX5512562.1 urea carboxylase-associated family protein [Kaistia algarum]PPE81913.1 hypothetical protein C3941_04295 [Kaistia algarum]